MLCRDNSHGSLRLDCCFMAGWPALMCYKTATNLHWLARLRNIWASHFVQHPVHHSISLLPLNCSNFPEVVRPRGLFGGFLLVRLDGGKLISCGTRSR